MDWEKEKLKRRRDEAYKKYKEDIKEVAAARRAVGKKWADNVMSKI